MTNPTISSKKLQPAAHGGGVRGDDAVARSASFEGRFGRLFRSLPPGEWPKEALMALGLAMTADPEVDDKDKNLPAASPETDKRIQDDEENAGIPAGYTYLGQFIDHDITFDPASSLQQQNDPNALVDFRTPRLDLDSVYGRGPDDLPYMYDGNKFRLGRPLFANDQPTNARDLPRYIDPENATAPRRALIGDKRNDENVIVSQLHGAMLRFHNKLVDADPAASFRDIQQRVRWHYQWIVLNDFLVKICGEQVVKDILPHLGKDRPIWENPPNFAIYKYRQDAFMPVEFSVAAYRFGHSMVRPIYRLNTQLNGGADPAKATHRGDAPRPGGTLLHLRRRTAPRSQRFRRIPETMGHRLELVLRHRRIDQARRQGADAAGLQDRYVPGESCGVSAGVLQARAGAFRRIYGGAAAEHSGRS